jgi:hypothetical protein
MAPPTGSTTPTALTRFVDDQPRRLERLARQYAGKEKESDGAFVGFDEQADGHFLRGYVHDDETVSHRSYERLYVRWTDTLAVYALGVPVAARCRSGRPTPPPSLAAAAQHRPQAAPDGRQRGCREIRVKGTSRSAARARFRPGEEYRALMQEER